MQDSLRLSLLGKKIEKWILSITGAGITLASNEMKDIMKKIKFKKIEEFYQKVLLEKLLLKKKKDF